MIKEKKLLPFFLILLLISCASFNTIESDQDKARKIKQTFESNLYTLSPYTQGYYGLRMYRQTQDSKYLYAIWLDLARISNGLFKQAEILKSKQDVIDEGKNRRAKYLTDTPSIRQKLRYQSTLGKEEYLIIGAKVISQLARLNEYGLTHKEEQRLRKRIKEFDFSIYALNPEMIRAWAAQLANQVYWLKQLGEDDLTREFTQAFQETYPDNMDASLSRFQYMNKIYGLTHIIFAASEYYRKPVKEENFSWIFDYYRKNIDKIIVKTKPDVIAEVGINFLLAGLEDDQVVKKARAAIRAAIDPQTGIVPPENGKYKLSKDEHRNVLSIMLLDWKSVNAVPNFAGQANQLIDLPYGISIKH